MVQRLTNLRRGDEILITCRAYPFSKDHLTPLVIFVVFLTLLVAFIIYCLASLIFVNFLGQSLPFMFSTTSRRRRGA
jgi:hypothetical protein